MAYTNIDDPSAYFQAFTYTGNGSNPRNLTNDGNSDLKPDLIWIKNRTDNGTDNVLANSTMGFDAPNAPNGGGQLSTNSSGGVNVPPSTYGYVSAALTNGFTAAAGGTNGDVANANGKEFVACQWKANGGTTVSNTDGSITTTVQANPTAGFSLVFYTGNGIQTGETVGHGLGAVPKMIISKDRDGTSNVPTWRTYHEAIGATKYLQMPQTDAASTFDDWDNTTPTSSVYSVGGSSGYTPANTSNTEYIAYVFADVQGYSKFGSYVGNGSTNGPFIYTGFKPAFVLIKNVDTAQVWIMYDGARKPFNRDDNVASLYANTSGAEYTGASYHNLDILSNGFKIRLTDASQNGNGNKHIYMAFAENPFTTSTGVPTTAR